MSEVIDRAEEAQSAELIELPPQETALAVYGTVGGLSPLIEQIRSKVAGTVYDMATTKGRSECASDAFKVAKSKAAIEKMGKALSATYKEIPKKIDAERKRAFDELEALQKQIRQPLTDWEQAEETRITRHKGAIERIRYLASEPHTLDSTEIKACITEVEAVTPDDAWEEFASEAAMAQSRSLAALREALAKREQYDFDQAELAKLRAEAEARAKQDEQDRIVREAAEQATRAAEAKAQAGRDAATKAAADAQAAADRRELELKLQAESAERERLEAINKAEQDAKDAIESQRLYEERVEAERLATKDRADQAVEAARQAERQRQADEAAKVEAETKAREANRAHKAKVNNAAVAALVAGGLTLEASKLAVTLIAKGEIPAVRINY